MRVVNARDMHGLPEGTIYCNATNDGPMAGGFHGYSEGLNRIGRGVAASRATGWWASELLPQPLPQGHTGRRVLRIRANSCTWREPPHPDDKTEEFYYVFDPEDVATLVAALGGPLADQQLPRTASERT